MDDETVAAEGLVDAGDAPVIDSTPDAELNTEPTTELASTETPDATLYAIKVAGEERQVTLEELTRLAQQGDDYTRKTQTLAERTRAVARAEAIQQALENDPQEALRALAEAYGISADAAADDELLDPMERRLRELERSLQTREQRERNAEIDRTIAELRTQFGDFDEDALFAHAMANGFNNLRSAYRDLHFDSVLEAQRKADEAAARVTAKRDAQVVHTGAAASGASSPKAGGKAPSSVREAWAQAKELLAT